MADPGMESLTRFLVQQPLHILSVAVLLFAVWALLKPRRAVLLAPAFAWLAYAGWEWLVLILTPEADIRMDLLLIWPLLAIVTLWPVVKSLFTTLLKKRKPHD